jgi:hypothetical protein
MDDSAHLLTEEQIVLSKLNNAFRGDQVKINMILGAWPHPRTLNSFVESFTNGYPPPIWDNLDLSEDDYKQVKSIIDNIHLELLLMSSKPRSPYTKKRDRMVCHLI